MIVRVRVRRETLENSIVAPSFSKIYMVYNIPAPLCQYQPVAFEQRCRKSRKWNRWFQIDLRLELGCPGTRRVL